MTIPPNCSAPINKHFISNLRTVFRSEFYFIRHAETESNIRDVASGIVDYALSDRGKNFCEKLQLSLPRHLSGFHSQLSRSRETAMRILPELVWNSDSGLNEHAFGEWDGISWKHVHRWLELNFSPPLGESRGEFVLRFWSTLEKICKSTIHTPIIVGHGGHLFALTSIFNLVNLELENLGSLHFVPKKYSHFPWETFKWSVEKKIWLKTIIYQSKSG